MFKVMVMISRRDGMSRERFLQHWLEDHPAFVRALPGVRRYQQDVAIEHRTQWPVDGIAELWFDSLRDIAIAFNRSREEVIRLFDHEDEFIGESRWFIAEEHDVPLTHAEGAR
jgi:uncharacterized protein (TIGR02118 family)